MASTVILSPPRCHSEQSEESSCLVVALAGSGSRRGGGRFFALLRMTAGAGALKTVGTQMTVGHSECHVTRVIPLPLLDFFANVLIPCHPLVVPIVPYVVPIIPSSFLSFPHRSPTHDVTLSPPTVILSETKNLPLPRREPCPTWATTRQEDSSLCSE